MTGKDSEENLLALVGRLYSDGSTLEKESGKILADIDEGFDWNHFFTIAYDNRVLPQAYVNLSHLRERCGLVVPERWRAFFENRYYTLLKKNLLLIREVDRLLDSIAEKKVQVMVIKGFAIKNLYPDDSFRQMADFDLVVRKPQDYAVVEDLLKEEGYGTSQTQFPKRMYSRRFYNKHVVSIDLHNEVYWGTLLPYLEPFLSRVKVSTNQKVLWERAEYDKTKNVFLPSPEEQIIISCLENLSDRKRATMRNVNDLALLLEHNEINWEEVVEYSKDVGALPFLKSLLGGYLLIYGPNARVEEAVSKIGGGWQLEAMVFLLENKTIPLEFGFIPVQLHYAFGRLRRTRGLWFSILLVPRIFLSQILRFIRRIILRVGDG